MNRNELQQRLRGIHAISIAPFTNEDSIDKATVERNVEYLVDGGLEVIVAAGNTGEFYTLSPQERHEIVALTAGLLEGSEATLVVGVGFNVAQAIADARHAADHGAAAVMVHQPPHPHASADGFLAYQAAVAAASPLPIIPYVSRPLFAAEAVPQLIERCEPVAVKYALDDPPALAACVAADEGRDVVWVAGNAEYWAPSMWPAGAEGFTSGLVNVAPELSRRMLDGLQSGDAAAVRAIWTQVAPFEQMRAQDNSAYNVAVVKEALRQRGLSVGSVRPPASEVGEQMRDQIRALLASWDAS